MECAVCSLFPRTRPSQDPSVPALVPQYIPTPAPTLTTRTPLSQSSPPFSPPLEEVMMYPIPTARRVLGPCRLTFATAHGHLLTLVAQSPTWEALYQLLVLPEIVL